MSAPRIDELPETIPVFPLTGAILLPGGDLPLNIFEPRYLSMVSDAMAGAGIVGMVQPSNPESAMHEPPIYGIGCAGRIDAFKETDDGRFIINLAGVCRFSVVREIERATLYRQVTAAYGDFRADVEGVGSDDLDRDRILRALHAYLEAKKLSADWEYDPAAARRQARHLSRDAVPVRAERKAGAVGGPFARRARTRDGDVDGNGRAGAR